MLLKTYDIIEAGMSCQSPPPWLDATEMIRSSSPLPVRFRC